MSPGAFKTTSFFVQSGIPSSTMPCYVTRWSRVLFPTCFWSYFMIGSSIILSEFSNKRLESTPAGPASSMQPLLTSSARQGSVSSYQVAFCAIARRSFPRRMTLLHELSFGKKPWMIQRDKTKRPWNLTQQIAVLIGGPRYTKTNNRITEEMRFP